MVSESSKKAHAIFRTVNVADAITAQAERCPDRVALICPDPQNPARSERHSFAEMVSGINKMGNGLKSIGIVAGDRVVLMAPMSLDHYLLLVALFKIGATAVYIDPGMGVKQVDIAAKLTAPKMFVGSLKGQLLRFLSPHCRNVPLQGGIGCPKFLVGHDIPRLSEGRSDRLECHPVRGEDVALFTFTSGSTGLPKGAARTHALLKAQTLGLTEEADFLIDDIYMPAFPIVLLANMAIGITSVIPNLTLSTRGYDAPFLARQIHENQVSVVSGPPAYCRALVDFARARGITFPKIRYFYCGGAPVPLPLLEEMQRLVPNGQVSVVYGSTESEPIAHVYSAELFDPKTRRWSLNGGGNPVGRPAECAKVRVIAPRTTKILLNPGEPIESLTLPQGMAGEIIVAGPHVNPGYFQNPEATAQNKIFENGVGGETRIWHRTGDIGTFNSAGNLWLLGRISNRVQIGREKFLYPIPIENHFNRHRWVERSALIRGQTRPNGRQKPILCVQLKGVGFWRRLLHSTEIKHHLRRWGIRGGYSIQKILFVNSLPLDPRHHSKIEYDRLRNMVGGDGG